MAERITRTDLDTAVTAYRNALESVAALRGPLQLQIGSRTYGNAYRVMFIGEGGGLSPAPGTSNGYLGMTAREAYDTLWTMTRTITDVRYEREQAQ